MKAIVLQLVYLFFHIFLCPRLLHTLLIVFHAFLPDFLQHFDHLQTTIVGLFLGIVAGGAQGRQFFDGVGQHLILL